MTQRIPKNTKATLLLTLFTADDPVDATGTVKITVLRANGTALIDNQDATKVAATTGQYQFVLTAANTAALGLLEARWTATIGGEAQTFVTWHEVVGAHLFTLAQLRGLDELGNQTRYPDEALAIARDLATYALEDACDTAFVPRAARHQAAGYEAGLLVALPHGRIQSIAGVSVDGTVLTADQLTQVRHAGAGLLRRNAGWGSAAEIDYVYGHVHPPPRVARFAMHLARYWLLGDRDTGIPERAATLDTDTGTYRLTTAGVGRALFDLPEGNAIVAAYAE